MDGKALTRRQKEILNCIEEYSRKNGRSPSYRELLVLLNLKSPATLHAHIQRLIKKKALHSQTGIARSLCLESTGNETNAFTIPLLGSLTSTKGIQKFGVAQSLPFSKELLMDCKHPFALKVVDNGFREECIVAGDILILEIPQQEFEGNQMALILINDQEALIKLYYHDSENVYLSSQYTSHQPIVLKRENVHIHGIVIHILRSI